MAGNRVVASVPRTLEDQALSQFFSSCGTISDLASDDNGLTLQKNVFITFDSDATAAIAIELSGTVLHGCPIMVNYAPATSAQPAMRMDGVIGDPYSPPPTTNNKNYYSGLASIMAQSGIGLGPIASAVAATDGGKYAQGMDFPTCRREQLEQEAEKRKAESAMRAVKEAQAKIAARIAERISNPDKAAKEDKKEAKQKTNEENKRQQRIEDSRANRRRSASRDRRRRSRSRSRDRDRRRARDRDRDRRSTRRARSRSRSRKKKEKKEKKQKKDKKETRRSRSASPAPVGPTKRKDLSTEAAERRQKRLAEIEAEVEAEAISRASQMIAVGAVKPVSVERIGKGVKVSIQ